MEFSAEYIAFCSLAVALTSLFTSLASYLLAKKTHKINEQEFQDRRKSLSPYLIQSFKWKKNGNLLASFAITYTNTASSQNSLRDISLEITYRDENGILYNAMLSPVSESPPSETAGQYEMLNGCINFSEKETKSGWVTFKIPTLEPKMHIETYAVTGKTSNDEVVSISAFALKTIREEHEQ